MFVAHNCMSRACCYVHKQKTFLFAGIWGILSWWTWCPIGASFQLASHMRFAVINHVQRLFLLQLSEWSHKLQSCSLQYWECFDLLYSLIQTLTLTPPPNNALLAYMNMWGHTLGDPFYSCVCCRPSGLIIFRRVVLWPTYCCTINLRGPLCSLPLKVGYSWHVPHCVACIIS